MTTEMADAVNQTKNGLSKILQNNVVTIIVNIIALVALVLNLFLATKLLPIQFQLEEHNRRILTIEEELKTRGLIIQRFYSVENEIPQIRHSIERIETKLDRFIESR